MAYRTKQEAYLTGCKEGFEQGFLQGKKEGIAQERARIAKATKKKLNPLYNRPLSLKERVDREAEAEEWIDEAKPWFGLGKTKQPSLWERLTRPIIRELKGFFRP